MSSSTRVPTQPAPRRRGALMPAMAVAAVLVLAFVLFTNVWTEKLWYQALGYQRVFTITFWTRLALFCTFGLLMALAVVGSTALAYKLRPPNRQGPMASELLERYREALETRFVQIMVGLGVIVGLFAGVSAAAQLQTFLAWINKTPFGTTDPRFGLDLSFYIFDYPWWRWVIGFWISMFTFAAIAAAIVHYVMGALRVAKGERRNTSKAAQAQLSVLVGLAVLGFAVSAWFDRYSYQTVQKPLLTGLTFTDDNARITASLIAAVITGLCALLFLINAVIRKWMIPIAALVLAVVSSVILSMIYPAAIQAFQVRPNEPDKERPYIAQHIQATRQAYGVDGVEVSDYAAKTQATAGQLRADAEALPAIRLMDPAVISPTFEQLQQVRGYYTFPRVLDVDRYTLDGKETDTVVAVRDLDTNGIDQSWNNLRTVYTHGFGLVAAYGNRRVGNGEPEWIVRDIPPVGDLAEHEPRIYYGEQNTSYAIVGAPAGQPPIELDTPGGGEGGGERRTTYTGKGGVPIGNWFDRLLYAVRFADVNILLSQRVNEASKVIYDRAPRDRVKAAAPWLTVDSNAYPAVVEGRIVWIVDGYTTSNTYPNSQRVSLQNATEDAQTADGSRTAQADQQVNYMRNSVKAVVDAYDGTVQMYAWDQQDPVLQTWMKAYPDTVQDRSQISADLLEHLRYPEDLFKVQRDILGRYHVTEPMAWFQGNDLWQVPGDPTSNSRAKENPYLLSVKMPGDDTAVFSQTSVFVPANRENLAGYLAVNADTSSPEYGRMRILRMSDTRQIDGPQQTFNAMVSNQAVADRLLSYRQTGLQVIHGNLLTVPLGGGLVYVNPVYTQKSGDGSYPLLTFVVVRFGEHVGIGETLQQALDQVFSGNAGASTGEEPTAQNNQAATPGDTANPTEPRPANNPAAVQALRDAEQAFADAQKALQDGDLGTYQRRTQDAQNLMQQALQQLGQ